jgi:hypothetical protein
MLVRFAGLLLLGCVSAAAAHDEDVPIQLASELRDWCRMESEARLVGEGKTPYNWTASYIEEANAFRVDGAWRVDGTPVRVACRSPRGAARRYAVLEIR